MYVNTMVVKEGTQKRQVWPNPTQPNQALLHFFLFTHDNLFIYLFIYEFIYLYTLLRK